MGEQQCTESAESHDQSYVRLRSFGTRTPSRKVSSSLDGERKWSQIRTSVAAKAPIHVVV
jgi:hypothetical protein